MRHASRVSLILALLVPLVSAAPAASASARDGALHAALADALAPLHPYVRTGVLYDRVLPLAHLESLDDPTSWDDQHLDRVEPDPEAARGAGAPRR